MLFLAGKHGGASLAMPNFSRTPAILRASAAILNLTLNCCCCCLNLVSLVGAIMIVSCRPANPRDVRCAAICEVVGGALDLSVAVACVGGIAWLTSSIGWTGARSARRLLLAKPRRACAAMCCHTDCSPTADGLRAPRPPPPPPFADRARGRAAYSSLLVILLLLKIFIGAVSVHAGRVGLDAIKAAKVDDAIKAAKADDERRRMAEASVEAPANTNTISVSVVDASAKASAALAGLR